MINEQIVEDLKAAAHIDEVVRDFIELKKHGANLVGLCPMHKEKSGSFTVSRSKGIYKCFGCGKAGDSIDFLMSHLKYTYPDALRYLGKKYDIDCGEIKSYEKPVWANSTAIDPKVVKWFENERKISQATLLHFKIQNGIEWMPQVSKEINVIKFPYFKEGECVNIKYRDSQKNFKLAKNAELLFYNLDCAKDYDELYIVEGEIDAMTLHQCGFPNVISVPNGAGSSKNNLQYIDNSLAYLGNIKKFHIATDNDVAGRKLKEDLIERLGVDKCDYVKFKDCKDANACLIKHGQQGVAESCVEKIDFPIEGVFNINDFKDDVLDYYENGLPQGDTLGMEQFDKLVKFHRGYLAVVSGVPTHGKTAWVDQMVVRLSLKCGWKGAFYSPENRPTKLHISKIIRLVVGKHWEGQYKMSAGEVNNCMDYLDKKLFFIKPEKDFTLDSILKSVEMLKRKQGLDVFVIDAWNKLEHKGSGDTEYVGRELDKIVDFCERHNVLCFLVAHPTKMKKIKNDIKYEIPTLYDISGSANFYNKADYGMIVYRDFETKRSKVIVEKVKYNHWGETGEVEFEYHYPSGRFYEGTKEGKYVGNWMFENERQEELFVAAPMPRNLNSEEGNLFDTNEPPPF